MCLFVRVVWRRVGGDWAKNFILICFNRWRFPGNREQNFRLFMFHISVIFELLLSNLTNDFYLTKVAKIFGGDKIMQMLLYLKGMVYKMISSVANLAVFCSEDCWINCFIRYAIKRSMIITFNQEFTAFNEPIDLFLFISFLFLFLLTNFYLVKLSLLAKHLSKYYLKNKNEKNFVERFEDIHSSYVLLPSINFPLGKHSKILKINPNCWNRHFCHCLKAAIFILRHTLTWFLDINKQINKQFCYNETSFILCLVSVLISNFYNIYWLSFHIWYSLSSNIHNSKDTVNCIQDFIKHTIFVDICN